MDACLLLSHTKTKSAHSSSVSEGHFWMMLVMDARWHPLTSQSIRLEEKRGVVA